MKVEEKSSYQKVYTFAIVDKIRYVSASTSIQRIYLARDKYFGKDKYSFLFPNVHNQWFR